MLVPTPVTAHEVAEGQLTWVNWVRVPLTAGTTVALVGVSGAATALMAHERMDGTVGAVAPIETHTVADGQTVWEREAIGAGSGSLPTPAQAVVAAYRTSGTVAALLVPVPVNRHLPDDGGQTVPVRALMVVDAMVGRVSAVQATAEVASPVGAMPLTTMGPVAPAPILPTPVARQVAADGHASEESEE